MCVFSFHNSKQKYTLFTAHGEVENKKLDLPIYASVKNEKRPPMTDKSQRQATTCEKDETL